MAIISDLQSLAHDAELYLYQLSGYNKSSPTDTFNFCNYNGVTFSDTYYTPVPCEITGMQYSSEGALARPKLRLLDVNQLISGLIYFYDGLEGSELKVISTLTKYLDGEATADATAIKIDEIYTVSQLTSSIPGKYIEYELSVPIDFIDEQTPARHCMPKCAWRYRSEECGYVGTSMYDLNNKPTTDPAKDQCSKTVTACTKRFGRNATLPFGGMPAVNRFT